MLKLHEWYHKKVELPRVQSKCKLHEWSIFFSYQNFDQSNKIVDSFQHLWLYGGVDLVYENYQIMV